MYQVMYSTLYTVLFGESKRSFVFDFWPGNHRFRKHTGRVTDINNTIPSLIYFQETNQK